VGNGHLRLKINSRDLVAAEAIYHDDCMAKFMLKRDAKRMDSAYYRYVIH